MISGDTVPAIEKQFNRQHGALMLSRNIVVLGASAGGIEALVSVVRGLPPDLQASLFIVVHVPPHSVSRLPEILSRSNSLPVDHASHGDVILPGHVYVAPPDQHMMIREGKIHLSRGPRENHSRPAIDPLFRSAARAYGTRTVGVILSGALYDGAAGLASVKARGGMAIVQDPDEASFPSMPRSALRLVEADYILPAERIGPEIGLLAQKDGDDSGAATMIDEDDRMSQVIERDFITQAEDKRAHEPTMYTCPDCGGVLWQMETGARGRFRCHVGHAYAPEVLLNQKSEELEAALWSCVRLLREKATLTRQTAARSLAGGHHHIAARSEETAQLNEDHARVIRELLESMPSPADHTLTLLTTIDGADQSTSGTD